MSVLVTHLQAQSGHTEGSRWEYSLSLHSCRYAGNYVTCDGSQYRKRNRVNMCVMTDDNHNRRLSAVVKIKNYPLLTDGTGSASQDSWAKSVVVSEVWKPHWPMNISSPHLPSVRASRFPFLNICQLSTQKKKEKKPEAAKLQRKHSGQQQDFCASTHWGSASL